MPPSSRHTPYAANNERQPSTVPSSEFDHASFDVDALRKQALEASSSSPELRTGTGRGAVEMAGIEIAQADSLAKSPEVIVADPLEVIRQMGERLRNYRNDKAA